MDASFTREMERAYAIFTVGVFIVGGLVFSAVWWFWHHFHVTFSWVP